MLIYLAARFERQAEMRDFAYQLRELGHAVTSRWIDNHIHHDKQTYEMNLRAANEDLLDIEAANILICFTEDYLSQPRNSPGKNIEFGYAFANGLKIYIVGPRQSVFHWLAGVQQFDTWEDFLRFYSNKK